MLGFINAMKEAMSLSVSDRCIWAAMRFSCSGVGTETGMASSCSRTSHRSRSRPGPCPLDHVVQRARRLRPRRSRRRLGIEMAGGEMAGADFPQFGLDFTTDIAEGRLATRVEAAAGGRVERAWDLAAKT